MRKGILLNILFIIGMTCLVSCNDDNKKALDEGKNTESGNGQEGSMDPITEFTAAATSKANELQLKWKNPSDAVLVEISYALEVGGGGIPLITNVRVYGEKNSKYTLQLLEFGTYQIAAVAIDNYGNRSEKVTISATPAEKDAIDPDIIAEYKLPIADPFVLYHEGKYYAYGTRVNGFEVYISDDLKHWKRNETKALSPENSWGARWYWAPEVYYVKSKNLFYMFYSVDEHICAAISTSPEGPFVQREKKPIVADEKGIDTSLFIDDDGTPYLYYVRFTDGNVIWVAEMNDDLTSIKKETLTKCISVTDEWEKKQAKVTEGPSLLKKGDTYYLIYSANHYESKDYAVGYATATSPKGPWTKYSGNPILRRDKEAAKSVGLVGTGHGAPFVCADGSYKYIFHAHASETSVGPRTSYISNFNISDKGVISITGETIEPVRIK
ncbi:1,4-beta-xylanase [Bacteroides caecimuris]|uniref:1,4-beta-xylanase n=1 Tax=Bacteroides caecimuris TaxID=1796613 RepID=A0A1C7H2J1_9BACE|nr:glycoside hydrolase family 43 protein [Bacteroides caecimuris]ANU59118.1 1,4-beta-xylanase [Bacteroides caecimuris]NDO61364.1 family 43 glycosylhydrolase [Bacteroides caecimuris]OXE68274.1 1,4-beta-xylanase [Bacteroides caecimuris]QQR15961.1 glycoside hydrolase family 43 protein [Bacteroides caecimuris]UQA28905.1 glycoside hydrolase family 43 protein [Bacteroides caecimuris]